MPRLAPVTRATPIARTYPVSARPTPRRGIRDADEPDRGLQRRGHRDRHHPAGRRAALRRGRSRRARARSLRALAELRRLPAELPRARHLLAATPRDLLDARAGRPLDDA